MNMFHSRMVVALLSLWNTDVKYAKMISEAVKFVLYNVCYITMVFYGNM